MFKRLASAALLAAASAAFVAPVQAAPLNVDISVGPPPPRVEVVPAPRPGYVWAPGYWDWRGGKHYWVRGDWQREREGYVYHHPEWVHHGDAWHLNRGGWER
jgi:WXXGXW repeat (2 copies)